MKGHSYTVKKTESFVVDDSELKTYAAKRFWVFWNLQQYDKIFLFHAASTYTLNVEFYVCKEKDQKDVKKWTCFLWWYFLESCERFRSNRTFCFSFSSLSLACLKIFRRLNIFRKFSIVNNQQPNVYIAINETRKQRSQVIFIFIYKNSTLIDFVVNLMKNLVKSFSDIAAGRLNSK